MNSNWIKIGKIADFPQNGGIAALVEKKQLAIFNFTEINEWFATDNRCPHKGEQCIARGLLGDLNGEPKVACPFHKRNFSLKTGECLSGDEYKIQTYPVKVDNDEVYVLI